MFCSTIVGLEIKKVEEQKAQCLQFSYQFYDKSSLSPCACTEFWYFCPGFKKKQTTFPIKLYNLSELKGFRNKCQKPKGNPSFY